MQKNQKLNTLIRNALRRKAVYITAAVFLLYTLCGFFLAPYLVTTYGPKYIQKYLNHPASIGKVRINPFIFTFECNDFSLTGRQGYPVLEFGRLFVDFELSSMFSWAWTFREISLDDPGVNVVVEPDGTLNLVRLLPPVDSKTDSPKSVSPPVRLVLHDINITDGEIDITDERQSTPATVKLLPLNLHLDNISTLPEREGPYSLVTTIGGEQTIRWSGEISLAPLSSEGRIAFENIEVSTAWTFGRDAVNLKAPDGRISMSAAYRFELTEESPQLHLEELTFGLDELQLTLADEETSFFDLQQVRLGDGTFDFGSRTLDVGYLTVSGGKAVVDIDPSGTVNLLRILRTDSEDNGKQAVPTSPNTNQPSPFAEDRPWQVNLKRVEVEQFALDYSRNVAPALYAGIADIGVQLAAGIKVGAGAPQISANDIRATISNLAVRTEETAEPMVIVDRLEANDGQLSLDQRNLVVNRATLDGGHVNLVRTETGGINLLDLITPTESREIQEIRKKAIKEVKKYTFRIEHVEVNNLTTAIADRTTGKEDPMVNVDIINASLNNIDGTSSMPFQAELAVKEGGRIAAGGTLSPAPPSVEAEIAVTDVALKPFQAYLDPVVDLRLHSGTFSTNGKFKFKTDQLPSDLAYEGGFGLNNLRLTQPGDTETLLGWKSLKTSQFKIQLGPNRLAIGEVKISRPEGKLIILDDGSINMARVFKTQPKEAPTKSTPSEKPKADLFPVHVAKLRIDDGVMEFADLSLRPQFGSRIHDLEGAVIGASSAQNARAQLEFKGAVDKYGQVKIDGEINMFDPKGFTDISMDFRNVEMSNLTPYSGKFAGRRIDSGKLSLDLEYKIEKSALLGENQVIVDRLVLGEKIESSDATNLPLDFAIALMEDQNGRIDIGLPVSGDLDNPEFHYGHLIWKALTNLIGKLVTSPFRALGGMFGKKDRQYDAVAFEAGNAEVPPPEREKLLELAEALKQRPQLKLVVQGRYSQEADGNEIKSLMVRREIATRRGLELGLEEDPGPVDFSNPDTQKTLEEMFMERFSEPELEELIASLQPTEEKDTKDSAKEAPPKKAIDPGLISKTLFNRMVESEPLPETILVDLATKRSNAIISELMVDGQIPVENLSQRPPEAMEDDGPVTAKLELDVVEKTKNKTAASATGS